MFHKGQHQEISRSQVVSAPVFLTHAESKRLIAKAVTAMPEVTHALKSAYVIISQGAHFIVRVELEKLVPSVVEAVPHCGSFHFRYSIGLPCGLIPLVNALEAIPFHKGFQQINGMTVFL